VQIFKTQMHIFFIFVTKTGVFATSALVFMALNLICYVLHRPPLFFIPASFTPTRLVPFESHLFTLSLLSLVPFELRSSLTSAIYLSQHSSLTLQLGPRRCSLVGKTGLRRKGYLSTSSPLYNLFTTQLGPF